MEIEIILLEIHPIILQHSLNPVLVSLMTFGYHVFFSFLQLEGGPALVFHHYLNSQNLE